MIDIKCSHCDFVFPAQLFGVPQIVRCPHCRECVTIPAATSDLETVSLSKTLSRKHTWKWSDIVLGFGFRLLMVVIAFMPNLLKIGIGPWISISWMIISTILFLTFSIWIYRKRVGSWPLKRIRPKHFLIESLWAFLYLLVYILIMFLLSFFIDKLFGIKDESDALGRYDALKFNSIVYISFLIFTFTIAPLNEELYYRGFLYNALKDRTPRLFAALSTAIFFALLHRYNIFGFTAILIAGLMFVLIYEHRKRLLSPVLAHAQMNFLVSLMAFILFVMNYHTPAQNWEEANIKPEWLYNEPPAYVERMESGEEQRLYAINTWGSQGVRLWKREANVFKSVLTWFPEDEQACAHAKLGMVNIYLFHLMDYRRAIAEADDLLVNFNPDRETCASAWLSKAYSYYNLKDYENSRKAAETVLSEYSDFEYEKYNAEFLLESLSPYVMNVNSPVTE